MQAIVVALISLMVMVMVGVIVVQNLINSQDQADWSADANDTWSELQTNIWVAFTLLIIAPIILAAVAIMSYLRYTGGG